MADEKGNGAANGETAWSYTIKLRHPVVAYGAEVKEIKLRQPTGMDYLTYGSPLVTDFENPTQISWDSRKVVPLIAALAQIPESAVRQMHVQDIISAQYGLIGFFLPRPGEMQGEI